MENLKNELNVKILKANSKKGFSLLENVNRSIKPYSVTVLAKSIMKLGILRPVVIAELDFMGIKSEYIIDGQHLYFALLRLGYDIPYTTVEIKDNKELIETLALVNTTSKSWIISDYVQAWGFIVPDYKKLTHYLNKYDLELCIIARILFGNTCEIGKVIKQGRFKIENEKQAVQIMDYTTDLLKIIPRLTRAENNKLVTSYITFVNSNFIRYNHVKFMAYIKKNITRLEFVNVDKNHLIDFYNKGI